MLLFLLPNTISVSFLSVAFSGLQRIVYSHLVAGGWMAETWEEG